MIISINLHDIHSPRRRSGCPLAVAAVTAAVTLQWRNARCRAFRTVRAAELHGANQALGWGHGTYKHSDMFIYD